MKPGTRKRAAEAIAEFLSLPLVRTEAFRVVCEKYDLAKRTLHRWLKALDTDAELANMVAELRAPNRVAWADRLAETKSRFLDELVKSVEELKTNSPDAVRAKADALKTITDIERTDQIAAAYLDQAAQSAVGRVTESGTPHIVLLTDGADIDDDQPAEAEQASTSSLEADSSANPPNVDASLGTGSR